ncbi:hypothetical protein GALMADRAFT_215425 [Galerina marginata CBS 339.88]|uniref:Uncharacterized protein n=1 Tax=Galerina marginata (strain CBS 339.88) TaxID=685588 RepID=A0A067SQT9_GALM3|nr:hypothetical protein GALMADRAFT_215425 [Galerina marginata CBS 339.88]
MLLASEIGHERFIMRETANERGTVLGKVRSMISGRGIVVSMVNDSRRVRFATSMSAEILAHGIPLGSVKRETAKDGDIAAGKVQSRSLGRDLKRRHLEEVSKDEWQGAVFDGKAHQEWRLRRPRCDLFSAGRWHWAGRQPEKFDFQILLKTAVT